jgi:BirA family biotin operon repressor/biotin-[acetyl-CoA-carboxylase] ligase
MWLDLPEVENRLTTATIGRRIVYLTSTGSTMDVARADAQAGAVQGTVVIAEEQSAGRGRFGRSWVSPAGKNLYFTVILRPGAEMLRALSVASPLAICQAIEANTGLSPAIKWPNDVLISGRKVAGVLIETELSGASPQFSLVGIGLNVNFDIPGDSEIAAIATSLKGELGRDASRAEVLASILNAMESLLETAGRGESIVPGWKARLETLGRAVTVTFHGQTYEGVAEDVDTDGNLLLRDGSGELLTIEAGEVTLRPPGAAS